MNVLSLNRVIVVEDEGAEPLVSILLQVQGRPIAEILRNEPMDNPISTVVRDARGQVSVVDRATGQPLYELRPGLEPELLLANIPGINGDLPVAISAAGIRVGTNSVPNERVDDLRRGLGIGSNGSLIEGTAMPAWLHRSLPLSLANTATVQGTSTASGSLDRPESPTIPRQEFAPPTGAFSSATVPAEHRVVQRADGQGREPQHTHPAVVHVHDHYHVTHHHRGGLLGEFEHRTYWHTHEHNHSELTHSHDYSHDDEEMHHDKEAHVHDHASPTESPG